MDGVNSHGFCGEVLGTFEYEEALTALKPLLERSNCHTLDRHDFRSHRDICGVGFNELWIEAVEQRYHVNHWPYYNVAEPQKTCFAQSFYDSLENLSKDLSLALQMSLVSGLLFAIVNL